MSRKRLSFGTVVLTVIETTFHRGGEYLRDAAVLVMVFIPLDLWKDSGITVGRTLSVIGLSAGIFLAGMLCEWTSYGVKRGKAVWDEEEAK